MFSTIYFALCSGLAQRATLPDYAAAVLANSSELADLIERARGRFGEKGLWGLASAVTAGQFYPTLKRGIGASLSCEILPAPFREAA